MPFRCSVLTAAAELEAHRDAWSALSARSATDGPMVSPLWLLTWWRVFGALDARRLRVVTVHDGERLVGLAPFVARGYRYRPGIPFRRLELLGTGEPEADEVCSEHVGVLAERGLEEPVARAFVETLSAGALGPWDAGLLVGPIDGDNPVASALVAALARAGVAAELTPGGPSYYIALPRSFAEYTASLSPSSRHMLTRSVRDLDKWAGGGVALHVATTPAELAEGKRVLFSLHGERWGGRGAFGSARFVAFHDQVMAALFARGDLEILWLTARGEPCAAAYDILWQGRVHYYQCGRRVDLPRNLRPGIALLARAVQRVIEGGRREYDFFGGPYRYKRELSTGCRAVVRLRAVRDARGLRERARLLAEDGRARRPRRAPSAHARAQRPRAGAARAASPPRCSTAISTCCAASRGRACAR